jgi:hypothetical protein
MEEIIRNAATVVHPEDMTESKLKLFELKKGIPFEFTYRNNPVICNRERRIRARCTVIGKRNGHPLLLTFFMHDED